MVLPHRARGASQGPLAGQQRHRLRWQVTCEICDGKGILYCVACLTDPVEGCGFCAGKGERECSVCDGTGNDTGYISDWGFDDDPTGEEDPGAF